MSESVEVTASVESPEVETTEEVSPVEEAPAEEPVEEVEETPVADTVEAPEAAEELVAPEASTVSLTVERDELKTLLSDRGEEVERLTSELSASTEEVKVLTARAVKAETELADATRKLTALTNGQSPVSTDAAETELSTTDNPFADARRKKK